MDILTITQGQGHGGEDETSAILYYNEELVQMDKAMKNPINQVIPVRFKDRGKIIEKIEAMQQGKYYE